MKNNKLKTYYTLTKETEVDYGTKEEPCIILELIDSVEFTPDDYGLILDALYEQAMEHPENRSYQKSLREVAKKFEKIFWR